MYIDLDGGTAEVNTVDLSKIDIVDIAFLENEIFDLRNVINSLDYKVSCLENDIYDLQKESYINK